MTPEEHKAQLLAQRAAHQQVLRMQAEEARAVASEWGTEPADRGIHPDWMMDRLERYLCIDTITFRWDQWMECRITCTHGAFRGVSFGMANPMGQSIWSAYQRFVGVDHELCVDDDHFCSGDPPEHADEGDLCPACGKVVDALTCPFDGKPVYANQ